MQVRSTPEAWLGSRPAHWLVAVGFVAAAAAGCSASEDPADGNPADAADTSVQDAGADTGTTDVAPTDADPGDTGPQDTGAGDTGPEDIGPGDVGEDTDTGDATADVGDADAGGDDTFTPPKVPGEWNQILSPGLSNSQTFTGLWVRSADDIYLTGNNGLVMRYDGSVFKTMTVGDWPTFHEIHGTSPDDIWAAGVGGALVHFDGANWSVAEGCKSDDDCTSSDPCVTGSCAPDGTCNLIAQPAGPACCGKTEYEVHWDKESTAGWEALDLFLLGEPVSPEGVPAGGVTWQPVSHVGQDGVARYGTPPYSMYFGIPDFPCDESQAPGEPPFCPTYNTGGRVGAFMVSGPIAVPKAAKVRVTFNLWMENEGFAGYDVLSLAVISGSSEETVWTKDTSTAGLEAITVDVSEFQGRTIRLKFSFDTVDHTFNEFEGPYVDDVMVVTECGALPKEGSAGETLYGVYAAAPDAVYAVGKNNTARSFNGAVWSDIDFGALTGPWPLWGVVGHDADSMVAVGAGGLVVHVVDKAVQVVTPAPSLESLRDMAAAPGEPLLAVGEAGTILVGIEDPAGPMWSAVEPPAEAALADFWGTWRLGPDAYIVAGTGGSILLGGPTAGFTAVQHGLTTQQEVEQPVPVDADAADGSASDATETVIVDVPFTDTLFGAWGTSPEALWVCGVGGLIASNVSGAWAFQTSPTDKALTSMHGSSDEDIWAVGYEGAIVHWDGIAWDDESGKAGGLNNYDVVAFEDGSAIIAGDNGLTRYRDGQYRPMPYPTTPFGLTRLWANGPDDVYAVGTDFVLHYDGNEDDVWDLVIYTIAKGHWRAACGTGPNDVYLVGNDQSPGAVSIVMHYDGVNWSRIPIEADPPSKPFEPPKPLQGELLACVAPAPGKLIAGGNLITTATAGGMVLELVDGRMQQSEVAEKPAPEVRGVYAYENLSMACGTGGWVTSATQEGGPWNTLFSGVVASMQDIDGAGFDAIYAVGSNGTVLEFTPDLDAILPPPEPEPETP